MGANRAATGAGALLLAVCGTAYVVTLLVMIRVLLAMRVGAALLFGSLVLLGVALNIGVLVLSRRDPARRNFTVPLALTTLIGSVGHFFLMGMAVVLDGLGG